MPIFNPQIGSAWRGEVVIFALACAAISGCATRVGGRDAASKSVIPAGGPIIDVDDVYRFYEIYDAAGGRPTAGQLQDDYIEAGSPGLEALCAMNFLNPDVEVRFVHVIAHEFVHVQQAPALVDGENLTVLEISLMEGAAEFVAELISGDVAYAHFSAIVAGRELEIETAFVADKRQALREILELTDARAFLAASGWRPGIEFQ